MAEQEFDLVIEGDSLLHTILILQKHFGRLPTDREVFRVIWGTKEEREQIWNDKGLPGKRS